jgi:hypothetical protein
MDNGLLHAHSGFRWLVVLFLVLAILKAFSGWFGKKEYGKADNLIAILLISFTHLQFVLGLAIYFMGGKLASIAEAMKIPAARFWAVEHGVTLILAIVLITLGRVKSKKATTSEDKHKKGAMFYVLAFILILWAGVIKPHMLKGTWF